MEGHVCNRIRIAIACVLLIAAADMAAAQESQSPPDRVRDLRVVVYTEPTAAVVEADLGESSTPVATVSTASRPKRSCHLEAINTDPGAGAGNPQNLALPTRPDQKPFWLICDGATVGVVWRNINPSPRSPTSQPVDTAMSLRDEIPMPQVSIRANPAIGLVGAESWFWVEGYSGAPIVSSTDAFGRIVEVEAAVTRYEWSFGDGVMVAGSLGRAYPDRSDIRHTYERSSVRNGDGYAVQVRFTFSVRYRIAGGPWVDLPGITRSATFRYPVQESQAVISR